MPFYDIRQGKSEASAMRAILLGAEAAAAADKHGSRELAILSCRRTDLCRREEYFYLLYGMVPNDVASHCRRSNYPSFVLHCTCPLVG
jgi:hypothetical protein